MDGGIDIVWAILLLFYVAKIFFPEWIVGIAEIPSIVAFGNFVDSHKWAYCVFHAFVGLFGGYFYYCACARTYKLNWKQIIIFVSFVATSVTLKEICVSLYVPFTYVMLIALPFSILLVDSRTNYKTFRSTAICFTVDIMAQAISLQIRNIVLLASSVNSATMTILMIDAIIWRVLLYLFFNQNNKEE